MANMPANVRVSAQFPFPATVQGAAPITLKKLNGVWTIGLNVAGLGIATPPPANYPTDYFLVYDSIAKTYFQMPMTAVVAQSAPVNPVLYGADPTGVNDSTAALNAALAASSYVQFPPGYYKFLSLITYTIPAGVHGVTIEGSGQDNTFLDWTNGTGGIRINFSSGQSSAHVRDMTIETGSAVSGNGLLFINSALNTFGSLSASSDVQNVTFRGNDGGGLTNAWAVGLNLVNVSNITVLNTFFMGTSGHGGNGINFVGNAGLSSAAVVLNVVSCDFIDMASGVIYGTWAQGLTVASSNFTAGVSGINVPGGLPPLTQLSVVNSQFEVDQALSLNSLVSDVTISSNIFIIQSTAAGIVLASTQDVSIVGNDFAGIATGSNVGVSIATTIANSGVAIIGNSFHQLTNGINLTASTVSGAVIANNLFFSNTNNITNSSTATNNRFHDNVGYNPVGVTAAATVGASPATITAGPTRETHYLKQSATNTATVTRGGQQVAALVNASTYYVVDLGPNESMVVTWVTTAPTDTKDVH